MEVLTLYNNRDRLVELLKDTLHEWECDVQPETVLQIAEHLIENGVVPVVRCKDCKWIHKPSQLCTNKRNRVFNTGIKRDFNCYCNYGERKCE